MGRRTVTEIPDICPDSVHFLKCPSDNSMQFLRAQTHLMEMRFSNY
ncbi:hypothetical protein PSP20601_04557 [Pandoraea sputorum]|uniref:Uncharacterized protein n=1 Tax=Pandoraea sputorum TaxID=93222 RepID=A0A239SQP0_9BURK|nr:Uncharacterised protein [Pandoraea sputorum]VVE49026.1 hypothetical protein PSP20601_04557 [Pandoraea sputorum]VVE85637.1 hypothetical protein PSP31120_05290 [Pandoraea sputorum]